MKRSKIFQNSGNGDTLLEQLDLRTQIATLRKVLEHIANGAATPVMIANETLNEALLATKGDE